MRPTRSRSAPLTSPAGLDGDMSGGVDRTLIAAITLGHHAQTDVSADEMVRIYLPFPPSRARLACFGATAPELELRAEAGQRILAKPTTRRGVTVTPSAASSDRFNWGLE